MNATKKIVHFITNFSYEDIPNQAVETVKLSMMDYIGSSMAGVDDESAIIVRRLAAELGGNPQATIWGTDKVMAVMRIQRTGQAPASSGPIQ